MTSAKLRFSSALTEAGWQRDVAIVMDSNGMIETINQNSKDGERIHGVAVAAMANVHSHAHQRLMAGLAERAGPGQDSFWTWRELMYGFAWKLGPQDLEAVAAQLYVEMLKSGYSVVGEFQYLHHRPDGAAYDQPAELSLRCLAAAEKAGIAITMLPVLYRYGGFGGQEPNPAQRRFVNDAEEFLGIYETLKAQCSGHDLRRAGIAPHSLRAVTKGLLDDVLAGVEGKTPIHIHVAEQVQEVKDCLTWCGKRPVEFLLDSFDIDGRWCVIHATHMNAAEILRLAKTGAVAGLCPSTEANLGDGIFPARDYLAAGGTIAIGSDSQVTVSSAEELRMLEYSQRLRDRSRNVLASGPGASTGRSLYDAALAGGAQAIGQVIGSLAPGKRADIVVLDDEHPALIGREGDSLLDSWIFSGGNACVKDVFVAGRQVVENRHHMAEEKIAADFRAAVARLA